MERAGVVRFDPPGWKEGDPRGMWFYVGDAPKKPFKAAPNRKPTTQLDPNDPAEAEEKRRLLAATEEFICDMFAVDLSSFEGTLLMAEIARAAGCDNNFQAGVNVR